MSTVLQQPAAPAVVATPAPPRRTWSQWYADWHIETPHWMYACQSVLVGFCVAGILIALLQEQNPVAIGILLALMCFGVGAFTQRQLHMYRFREIVAVAGKRRIAIYIEGEDTEHIREDAIATLTKVGLFILQHDRVPDSLRGMQERDLWPTVVGGQGQTQVLATASHKAASSAATGPLPGGSGLMTPNEKPGFSEETFASEDATPDSTQPDEAYVWGQCVLCEKRAGGIYNYHGELTPLCDADARKLNVLHKPAPSAKA